VMFGMASSNLYGAVKVLDQISSRMRRLSFQNSALKLCL
jgi:hypothetical protein